MVIVRLQCGAGDQVGWDRSPNLAVLLILEEDGSSVWSTRWCSLYRGALRYSQSFAVRSFTSQHQPGPGGWRSVHITHFGWIFWSRVTVCFQVIPVTSQDISVRSTFRPARPLGVLSGSRLSQESSCISLAMRGLQTQGLNEICIWDISFLTNGCETGSLKNDHSKFVWVIYDLPQLGTEKCQT